MAKWLVTLDWSKEYEAEDEGEALMQAEFDAGLFSSMRAREVYDEQDEQG